ncbi:TetR/AcrR family transcriptional regulator [Micromonosporaceae bacterium Da 78-11]
MARPRVHSDDAILDAVRDLLVLGGSPAATTAAISATSGAPVGSLYHRFGSRAQLLAEVWLRTVSRFQTGLLAAADRGTGTERALAAADWTVEFAVRYPADARLLLQAGREELLAAPDLPTEIRESLAVLNEPVTELFRRLATEVFGAATPAHLELLTIAVVDVPYAIVRRHLRRQSSPQPHRQLVADAVRALLESPSARAPSPSPPVG